jgi:hypothetical protein
MSATLTFDTFLYIKKLRDAGVDEVQAEIQAVALKKLSDQQAEIVKESLEHRTIINQDILLLKTEIDKLKLEMRMGFEKLRIEMHTADDSMKWRLNAILGLLTLFGSVITLAQFIA